MSAHAAQDASSPVARAATAGASAERHASVPRASGSAHFASANLVRASSTRALRAKPGCMAIRCGHDVAAGGGGGAGDEASRPAPRRDRRRDDGRGATRRGARPGRSERRPGRGGGGTARAGGRARRAADAGRRRRAHGPHRRRAASEVSRRPVGGWMDGGSLAERAASTERAPRASSVRERPRTDRARVLDRVSVRDAVSGSPVARASARRERGGGTTGRSLPDRYAKICARSASKISRRPRRGPITCAHRNPERTRADRRTRVQTIPSFVI